MTDAPVVGDRDLSADAIVGRIFEATVAAFDLLSVVIGDRLVSTARSLATGVRHRASWRPEPRSPSGTHVSGSSNRPRPGS